MKSFPLFETKKQANKCEMSLGRMLELMEFIMETTLILNFIFNFKKFKFVFIRN